MTAGAYSEVVKFLPPFTTVEAFEAWLECERIPHLN
jgi:hypothetical protein